MLSALACLSRPEGYRLHGVLDPRLLVCDGSDNALDPYSEHIAFDIVRLEDVTGGGVMQNNPPTNDAMRLRFLSKQVFMWHAHTDLQV